MSYQYPTDKSGTAFNPVLHNLLNSTAQPQLSKAGNFVELRTGTTNPDDLIERFHSSLAPAADDVLTQEDGEGVDSVDDADDTAAALGLLLNDDADDGDDEPLSPSITATAPAADDVAASAKYSGDLSVDEVMNVQRVAREHSTRADFSNGGDANRYYAGGKGYDLSRIDLSGQNLKAAVFSHCNLSDADFSGADLEGAIFTNAIVDRASFHGADLRFTVLPDNFFAVVLTDDATDRRSTYKQSSIVR